MNRLATWTGDAGILLVVALSLPFVILLLGAPIALVVRLVLEIARWLSS